MRRLPCSSNGKESDCKAEDQGLIPGLGSSSGEGSGNPPQYSCLENSMDREAWQATVCVAAKSRTWLSDAHTHTHPRWSSKLLPNWKCRLISVTTSCWLAVRRLRRRVWGVVPEWRCIITRGNAVPTGMGVISSSKEGTALSRLIY